MKRSFVQYTLHTLQKKLEAEKLETIKLETEKLETRELEA